MLDQLFRASQAFGLLLFVGLVGCASPPPDEPTRMWVSIGGDLESFEDDEHFCTEEATTTVNTSLDEPFFAVCMFERGWRDSKAGNATLASVSPVSSVRSQVNVRAHPSKSSEVLAGLLSGQRAHLLGREGEWYHVRLPDGEEGYVSARWTKPLE